MAWGAVMPARCRTRAKSIIRMAFFFTMPTNKITPIKAMMENSVPVSISASKAPTPAEGKVDKIVSGCSKLSYNTPSTRYSVSNAASISKGWVSSDF